MFALGFATAVSAQTGKQHFSSRDNNSAIETWKYVADNNKTNEHDWAKAVYKEFGLNDAGEIQHRFVVNARDSFDIPMVMTYTRMWLEKAFTTPTDSIVMYDVEKRTIKAHIKLVGLGDAYGFGGFAATNSEAHVTIPMDITIQFKENRLRYEARIANFILNSSDWVKDVVNKSLRVTECFPVNSKAKHRDSFSRAYINGNAKCLTTCRDYINYLNTHFGEKPKPQLEDKKKSEDDW